MSSLTPETKSVFLVQSGVIAWEDPKPIADWRRKTISICAARLQYLVSIAFELISLHPPQSLFRFHSSPVPANTGVAQKRNLIQSLCKDSPGFKGSYVSSTRDRICIASELANPLELDLNYLSAYRSTILLAAGSNTNSPEDLCNSLCGIVPDFGGASIAQLLDHSTITAALRVLDNESHSVVQVIGSTEMCAWASGVLIKLGVRQIHDVRTVSAEISRLGR